jgi:NNP family nitrate/nitrite transporter-like MFS transporter
MSESTSQENRVLTLSTIAFTLMFAVWLQFGILSIPIQKEFHLSETQFYWLTAVPILNGSIWRLATGIWADKFGGKRVMMTILLITALPVFYLSQVKSVTALFVCAFLIGIAGNAFSAGIAWNNAWYEHKHLGFALGVFGAGNVGASVTKFIGPAVIASTSGAVFFGGLVTGGWRVVPVIYTALILIVVLSIYLFAPKQDRKPNGTRSFISELEPLKEIRVWRFSLYYVAVFGAYVALSSILPKYYEDRFGVDLWKAALLTALFIFPASLLRPFGGALSDRYGARRIMYWTFTLMLITSGLLMMPNGFITIDVLKTKSESGTLEVMPWHLGILPFTVVLVLLGCSMGIGKAAVYKHIPEYFPHHVGAVGGLVGMLGALGGFFMLPLFGYVKAFTGLPTSPFIVLFFLTVWCFLWMHLTVHRLLQEHAPHLENVFEKTNH